MTDPTTPMPEQPPAEPNARNMPKYIYDCPKCFYPTPHHHDSATTPTEQPRSQEAALRAQVEQAFIDGSVAGSPIDHDGNRPAEQPRSQEAAPYGDLPPRERPVLFWRGASEANEGLLLAGIVVSPAEFAEHPRSQEAALAETLRELRKPPVHGSGRWALGWNDALDAVAAALAAPPPGQTRSQEAALLDAALVTRVLIEHGFNFGTDMGNRIAAAHNARAALAATPPEDEGK